MVSRDRIVAWTIGLTAAFTAIAGWVCWFRGIAPGAALTAGEPVAYQLALGCCLGFLVSLAGFGVTRRFGIFRDYEQKVLQVYRTLRPTPMHLVVVAFCAGWGEELFFRATIQPFAGIWLASLVFWFAHGSFSLSRWGPNLYGVVLFAAGLGLGWLYEHVGLLSAIAAHTALDLTSLLGFYWIYRRSTPNLPAGLNPPE